MTIQVTSTSEPIPPPAVQEEAPKVEATPSAPESTETHEPNESSESDTEEKEATESEQDESEATEDSEETEAAKEAEKDKPKKKGGFQRRIDKLNARYTAAQAEAEHWKQQALKGAGTSETKAEAVETTPLAEGKPNPESFDTHTEYVEALTDWKIEQREKAAESKKQQTALVTEQETLMKAHYDRCNSFKEKTTDFDEVIEAADHVRISATVQQAIVSSKNGPEILYELAKNPDELARICALPSVAAALEIGEIKARLASTASATPKTETKKLTNAPKPIDPVGGGRGTTTKSIYDPNISFEEYERRRDEQMKRKQG